MAPGVAVPEGAPPSNGRLGRPASGTSSGNGENPGKCPSRDATPSGPPPGGAPTDDGATDGAEGGASGTVEPGGTCVLMTADLERETGTSAGCARLPYEPWSSGMSGRARMPDGPSPPVAGVASKRHQQGTLPAPCRPWRAAGRPGAPLPSAKSGSAVRPAAASTEPRTGGSSGTESPLPAHGRGSPHRARSPRAPRRPG
jgi:hypothetical protein